MFIALSCNSSACRHRRRRRNESPKSRASKREFLSAYAMCLTLNARIYCNDDGFDDMYVLPLLLYHTATRIIIVIICLGKLLLHYDYTTDAEHEINGRNLCSNLAYLKWLIVNSADNFYVLLSLARWRQFTDDTFANVCVILVTYMQFP